MALSFRLWTVGSKVKRVRQGIYIQSCHKFPYFPQQYIYIYIYIHTYIATWTAQHLVNTPPPPPAVFLHAVPSRAEVSRSEPSRAEARWLLRSSKQLLAALPNNSGIIVRVSGINSLYLIRREVICRVTHPTRDNLVSEVLYELVHASTNYWIYECIRCYPVKRKWTYSKC
jgi:hypothetical protein